MLNPVYNSAKARISAQVGSLKDVQWYNRQYEGILLNDPVAYIEFPDQLDIASVSKSTERAPCTIKVHVVSKIIADSDNTIPDEQLQSHEDLSALVKAALKHYVLLSPLGAVLGTPLQDTAYQVRQDIPGLLITILTFTTKILVS